MTGKGLLVRRELVRMAAGWPFEEPPFDVDERIFCLRCEGFLLFGDARMVFDGERWLLECGLGECDGSLLDFHSEAFGVEYLAQSSDGATASRS